jgi:hypothetical protein
MMLMLGVRWVHYLQAYANLESLEHRFKYQTIEDEEASELLVYILSTYALNDPLNLSKAI